MTSDPLTRLTELICSGIPWAGDTPKNTLAALFDTEGLFHTRHLAKDAVLRDAYALARTDDRDGGVPYAGLINPENPPSGPYGGTSLVWFPSEDPESSAGYSRARPAV